MSDLISKSKLLDSLIHCKELGRRSFEAVMKTVDKQPTVDAVAVIRCRDCAHWGTGLPGEIESVKCCEYAGYMICENGYCLYGERK